MNVLIGEFLHQIESLRSLPQGSFGIVEVGEVLPADMLFIVLK